ncbi:hypothetical protein CMV_006258 [Castanea mollissima]|uniref:Uncharacterized protein n=1 Tax=Castanea mollissima TaxID=60419 RepID=A0A8J4RBT6_9ROSI|nr:hypothetical protein CMV_006258 [Castanea mollissima]
MLLRGAAVTIMETGLVAVWQWAPLNDLFVHVLGYKAVKSCVHIQQLPDRCYSFTVRHPLMVVGTADCNLIVFNLQNPLLIDKDPRKAISLFWSAINAGDRLDSALKDMAIVMKQLDQSDKAIEAIKSFRHLCPYDSQESLGNVLVELYKPDSPDQSQIPFRLMGTMSGSRIPGDQRQITLALPLHFVDVITVSDGVQSFADASGMYSKNTPLSSNDISGQGTLLQDSAPQLIGRSAASPSATTATSFDNTTTSPLQYANSSRAGNLLCKDWDRTSCLSCMICRVSRSFSRKNPSGLSLLREMLASAGAREMSVCSLGKVISSGKAVIEESLCSLTPKLHLDIHHLICLDISPDIDVLQDPLLQPAGSKLQGGTMCCLQQLTNSCLLCSIFVDCGFLFNNKMEKVFLKQPKVFFRWFLLS